MGDDMLKIHRFLFDRHWTFFERAASGRRKRVKRESKKVPYSVQWVVKFSICSWHFKIFQTQQLSSFGRHRYLARGRTATKVNVETYSDRKLIPSSFLPLFFVVSPSTFQHSAWIHIFHLFFLLLILLRYLGDSWDSSKASESLVTTLIHWCCIIFDVHRSNTSCECLMFKRQFQEPARMLRISNERKHRIDDILLQFLHSFFFT